MWLSSWMTVALILYLELIHYPKHLCGGKQYGQGRLMCLNENRRERIVNLKKLVLWVQHETVQLGLTCPENSGSMSAGRSPHSHFWASSCFSVHSSGSVCSKSYLRVLQCCVGWRLQRSDNSCSLQWLSGEVTIFSCLREGQGISVYGCSAQLQHQVIFRLGIMQYNDSV